MIRTILFAALLLGAPLAQAESMYKWVDEKGVTHFSSDPPANGNAQKIEVKPQPPNAKPPVAQPEDVRRRATELRDERLAKEKREDDARKRGEQDKSRCIRAQSGLAQLRRAVPVYSVNERGERVYMEDKERAAEMARLQGAIDTYCR